MEARTAGSYPRARRQSGRICVRVEDMPVYPDNAVRMVERDLLALPRERLWFTYKDVRAHFGISRATAARRLRDALVPGITMEGEHVVEDGPVRRFDRDQLKWLLLASRFSARGRPASHAR